ncbi:hypothetical protein SPONN_626 [uncultured Candidatus Thioglobus sp.]|nr:hypothetical protein SPONN_626 [uncultured Candidatus Thioglobus sp.]
MPGTQTSLSDVKINPHRRARNLVVTRSSLCNFFIKVEYGLLVASVSLQQSREQYCLIQMLEPVCVDNEPITDNLECPLLTLSNNFYAVQPQCIQTSISIVHQCTHTCTFIDKSSSLHVEREVVLRTHLFLNMIGASNNMYCRNILCINQSFDCCSVLNRSVKLQSWYSSTAIRISSVHRSDI